MSDGRLNFKATIDDSDFNRKLSNMEKGVNAISFEKSTKSLSNLNKEIDEVTANLTENRRKLVELNNQLAKTAPGSLYNDLSKQRNSLKKNIKEEEIVLKELNSELRRVKESHTTVNAELLRTRQQMQALAMAGKTNTREYQQLSAQAKHYSTVLQQVNRDSQNVARNTEEVTRKSRGLRGVFSTIASYFGVFAAIDTTIRLIRDAFNTIVQFDSRLLNVSKTTGLAGQELKDLGVSLRGLSQELKVISVDKLMEFAGVAGQLGIKGTQEILAFTEALAKLSVTSNIQGEEGAIQIARFLGLVEGNVNNVKSLGDELTNLGNNFKVFEDEIIKNALAIAQNTGTFKLGRQEILAYAVSLKEAGVEAELTGASLGRTYQQIEKVLRTGKNIDNLAKITGQSIEELKQAFKTDPQGVVYSFIKGLNEVQKAGGSVNNAITSIGITATRDLRVIGTLATGGFDVLNRAMNDVKDSSGAMQQEFETASGKISNSIEAVKVSWENLILSINSSENVIGNIANAWLRGLAIIIDGIKKVTTSWRDLLKIQGAQAGKEAYEYEKAYYGTDYSKLRDYALEDRKRYAEELSKINKQIFDSNRELTEREENRGFFGWAFMGNRGLKKLKNEIKESTIEASKLGEQIRAIDDLESEFLGKENELAKKEAERLVLEAEAERKKREAEAQRNYKQRIKFIEDISKIERDLNNSVLSEREQTLAKINDKYDDQIKKAKELKATSETINKIESLRAKETEIVTYKAETESIKIALEQQKKDYEDFENFKKQVGVEKATEMYKDLIDVSKSYYDVLNDEISQLSGKDLTDLERERLNGLLKLAEDYSKNKLISEKRSLEELIISTRTTQEHLIVIQEEFAKKREELEKITDENIRNERLKILEQQEKDAILSIENEIYEKGKKERELIKQLTSFTRRELQIRLKSTEEYLNKYSEFLSEDQKRALESEADLLNSIIGATDQISRQNALLKEKERITKAIKNNTSKDPEIAKKLNEELTEVNTLLEDNADKTKEVFEWIQKGLQVANMLADAFGGANQELQRAMNTLNNLVNSLASGNMVGAVVTVVDWLIQGVKDVFGRDTEAERRRNSERLRNQEEYNRMLREQLLLEIRLNDEYQSRVQAMKEEQNVLINNQRAIADRMKEILNDFYAIYKDLGSPGFLDFDTFATWQLLGLNEYFENGIELSDELLNKLIELNSIAPLEGYMKDLYDELMRLRDEFGSVDEAIRELEKELKDRLTGTTAQSLGDSIREGIASGKRSFADFADDVEGFLRNAILAGMSTAIIEPQIQQLQDMLYEMMKDGVLTEEERRKFEEKYAQIAEEAGQYLDLINQAGVNIGDDLDIQSAKDGIKRITESQADRLTGILTGMQTDVIASRQILITSRNLLNSSLDNLVLIEVNTRRTYEGVERIETILQNNQQQSLGL